MGVTRKIKLSMQNYIIVKRHIIMIENLIKDIFPMMIKDITIITIWLSLPCLHCPYPDL